MSQDTLTVTDLAVVHAYAMTRVGAVEVRITGRGDVFVSSILSNPNCFGWWFVGHASDVLRQTQNRANPPTPKPETRACR